MMKTPRAKQIPYSHLSHADERPDNYYWLNNRNNPEVIDYLTAENKYYDGIMRPLEKQKELIYESMTGRIPETEEQVPVRMGNYFYYFRLDKTKQYPLYARKKALKRSLLTDAPEEIILDVNELAEEGGYLNITERRMCNDHTRLAYLENRDGTDCYTAFIKDLQTNKLLPDRISNVFIYDSLEWSNCDKYLFYVTVDKNQRPYRLWRRELGTDPNNDTLIYEESDNTFDLSIKKSQSGKFLIICSASTLTTEVWLLDADKPLSSPVVVAKRRCGIEYSVEHHGAKLYILSNENALNFQLFSVSLYNFSHRVLILAHDENRYLLKMHPFENGFLISYRENGLTQIGILKQGRLESILWDEPLYTVSVLNNQDYNANEALIRYTSMLTPRTTYEINVINRELTCLQVAPVSGGYERGQFIQEHLWVTADDGIKIPVCVAYKKDALHRGPAPLILQGYGSYGATSDPYFSPYYLPLLEKGVILAIAQVRGGSEMGRQWYEDGKLRKKMNTFTDFLAAAKYFIEKGYTTAEKMAARGGSAGGLLIGAVANLGGEYFKVLVPDVPFVDVVTTMLDSSIPLTTLEWDEWGNPQNEGDYFYMKSYSPYDNVVRKDYPHMYVTSGLNDPRVGYWEPAKWVARLREFKTDNNIIAFKIHMGTGHFGLSGRLNYLKEEAACYAFVLDKLGVKF